MLWCWDHSCQVQTATVAAVKDSKNRKGSKGSSVAVGPGHLGHARSIRNCQCTVRSTEIAQSISPGSWLKPRAHQLPPQKHLLGKEKPALILCALWKIPNSCIIDLTEYSAKQKQKHQTKWQLTALQEAVVSREHQHIMDSWLKMNQTELVSVSCHWHNGNCSRNFTGQKSNLLSS